MKFTFLTIAILLFAGFRTLSFVTEMLKMRQKHKTKVRYLLVIIELSAWIGCSIWLAKTIYESRNYFSLISITVIFILIAFPLFILIRDFTSGMILKLQNTINEGTYIEIESVSGLIKKAGHFRIDIEDIHGTVKSLSYFSILGKQIVRSENNHNLEKVHVNFEFSQNENINELSTMLKNEVANTPWVAVPEKIVINNTEVKNGKIHIEISAYVLDRSYAENIKDSVSHFMYDRLPSATRP